MIGCPAFDSSRARPPCLQVGLDLSWDVGASTALDQEAAPTAGR